MEWPLVLALCALSFVVGVLTGGVGIGGVLLIPMLGVLTGLSIHAAMATALFTFLFTGLVGTYLFHRRSSIVWPITVPLCAGTVLFGFPGAAMSSKLAAPTLTLALAVVVLFAGVYTLANWRAERAAMLQSRPALQRVMLVVVGALVGFASGLTGVGGPAVSVPILMLLGFAPLATIGASQVVQIAAAASGTLGNLQYGTIDFMYAAIISVFEVAGVLLGARIVHAVNVQSVRRFVAVLCIAVGAGMLARIAGLF